MRLGLITPRFPPVSTGGGEYSARLLAQELHNTDSVTVSVISFDGSGEETVDGVTVKRIRPVPSTITEIQNIKAYRYLRNHVDEFDIIHGLNMELNPVIGVLSATKEIPSVATLNSYHFFPKSVTGIDSSGLEKLYELIGMPTSGRVLRHFMKSIDLFIARSQAVKRIYSNHDFSRCRIQVIPNMLDPGFQVTPEGRGDGINVLYVGDLSKSKGVADLVEAMALLSDEYELTIIGSGELESKLIQIAEAAGVECRVEFLGFKNHEIIDHYYSNANVFVHPGVWPDPFPRTVLEAMQSSLPIACTEVGGPVEIDSEGVFFAEPNNPKSLASAIKRASIDREISGEANRKYVYEHHSPENVVPQIIEAYTTLVE